MSKTEGTDEGMVCAMGGGGGCTFVALQTSIHGLRVPGTVQCPQMVQPTQLKTMLELAHTGQNQRSALHAPHHEFDEEVDEPFRNIRWLNSLHFWGHALGQSIHFFEQRGIHHFPHGQLGKGPAQWGEQNTQDRD